MQKLKIMFNPDGSLKMEAEGYADATCLKATEELEKELGIVTNRTKKPEALRAPTVGIKGVTIGKK
jgi:3-deoxy-D-manno-octulosonate 8-phosphate phosphatase KdsC-like HAD superfamily phosphatase